MSVTVTALTAPHFVNGDRGNREHRARDIRRVNDAHGAGLPGIAAVDLNNVSVQPNQKAAATHGCGHPTLQDG